MRREVPERPRSKGWTAYNSRDHLMVLADGEVIPFGYIDGRPATEAEIATEQAKREAQAEKGRRITEFRARPDWQDADDIRGAIEMMEYDSHPLDRLTPKQWHTLRNQICGWKREP